MTRPIRTPKQKFIAALLVGLTAFLGYLLREYAVLPPDAPPPQGPLAREVASPDPPRSFGWVPDPAAVAALKGTLPVPEFRGTEAFRAAYQGPEDVYLWDACRQVRGELIPPREQGEVGACVAFGTASAIEHLICVQIATGSEHEYRDLAQEVIYGGSRVEVGGNRIRGDGSIGAWAAQFVKEYGVVPRGVHGRHDLTRYSERRCRAYGRGGVPDDLEPVARKYPVRSVTNVRSWDECRSAIRNGYPVAVCSSQGFAFTRDADGFCRPQGVWFHCLSVVGVRGGPRPGGFLLNSWGPHLHRGPTGPGRPSPAGFWVDAAVLDRMLAEGDSWAFSQFAGFPARHIDWLALRPPERDPLTLTPRRGR